MNQKTTQQIYPELPEWSKRDDLGGLVPSEVRQALRAYADETCEARAAAASKPQVKEARERRRWLSDSFNRGAQTLDEATVSARAMALALATPVQAAAPGEKWHAPGLGEVHNEAHDQMIFCEDDDGVVNENLAEMVCRALNAAPAQAGEYPPLMCDYCGSLTPDPWHSSGMLHGKMSKHIHSCDSCAARGAAKAALADPMQWPLPCDVKVGHVTIPKGCALNTLVTRMQVLYEMGVDAPERPYDRGFRHGYNRRDAEVKGALL